MQSVVLRYDKVSALAPCNVAKHLPLRERGVKVNDIIAALANHRSRVDYYTLFHAAGKLMWKLLVAFARNANCFQRIAGHLLRFLNLHIIMELNYLGNLIAYSVHGI